MLKTYERHPLSAKYRDLAGKPWERFKENLGRLGIVNGRKIVLHEGKILDGWQLYRACRDVGVTPEFTTLSEGIDPEDFVETVNDSRRHMTDAELAENRKARIERVATARQEGKSLRTIAAEEGVSESQIRLDVKTATAQGCAVDPPGGKVTGQDGRSRPAAKPKPAPKAEANAQHNPAPKVLCKRCQRVGAVAGCTACKMARQAARNGDGKGDAYEGEPAAPKVALMDQVGNPVPKSLRDTFVGNSESLESGVKLLQEVRRTVKGLQAWNAWMRPAELERKLADLIEDFKNGLPYAVCAKCEGKGCTGCRKEGWLPRWNYEEVKA
jgi:transposase